MSYLVVENLVKSFGSFKAVDDVTIRMAKGEVCSLLGPSGCGKTTTLRSIAGLETFDAGRVVLDGRVLADPAAGVFVQPEHRNLGMVFQSYALWPHKSVFDNIALGLKIKGRPMREVQDKVADVLALVGMPDTQSRSPSSLSGGQQQRVALARALALEPKCLLFDEPLSNLDLLLRERMRFEIRELLDKIGITAVYVTHDQSEAMALSDHIVVMNHGVVQQEGAPADIYTHPQNRFTAEFLGRTNLLALDRRASSGAAGNVVSTNGVTFASKDASRLDALDEPLVIAFRPEMARVVKSDDVAADAPNLYRVRVVTGSFLGAHTTLEVELAGHRLNVTTPGRHAIVRDQEITIHIDPEHVLLVVDNAPGVLEEEAA
jgi:ABC-type Fe3+/spermidine/putrescine transport system ATPase subunit